MYHSLEKCLHDKVLECFLDFYSFVFDTSLEMCLNYRVYTKMDHGVGFQN